MATAISLPTTSTGTDAHAAWLTIDGTIGRLRDSQTYTYSDYNLGIPPGSVIEGIEVILYGTSNHVDGPDENWIYVSNDGGTSWSSGKDVATTPWGAFSSGTTNAQTERAGDGSDLWGESWNATTANNIQVKFAVTTSGRAVYVDYTQVRITYTPTTTDNGGRNTNRYIGVNGLQKSTNNFLINGLRDANVGGLVIPYPPHETPPEVASTIYSWNFNTDTGLGDGSSTTLPTGWAKADSGNMTVFSGTTDSDLGANQTNRGWVFGKAGTGSSGTGPNGGHLGGVDGTSGAQNSLSNYRYLYVEASSPAYASGARKYHLIRTNELDFSSYTTITLTFWFHHYSTSLGVDRGGDFGVAATTNASSADSGVQAGTGLGFTGDGAGGATIVYWDDNSDDGSSTSSGVRISGQQQATNAEAYRKATVDLSNAAGESSVYIYFLHITKADSRGWASDFAVDSVKITAL